MIIALSWRGGTVATPQTPYQHGGQKLFSAVETACRGIQPLYLRCHLCLASDEVEMRVEEVDGGGGTGRQRGHASRFHEVLLHTVRPAKIPPKRTSRFCEPLGAIIGTQAAITQNRAGPRAYDEYGFYEDFQSCGYSSLGGLHLQLREVRRLRLVWQSVANG